MDPDLHQILSPPEVQGLNLQLLCWLSSFQVVYSVLPLLWTHRLVVTVSSASHCPIWPVVPMECQGRQAV